MSKTTVKLLGFYVIILIIVYATIGVLYLLTSNKDVTSITVEYASPDVIKTVAHITLDSEKYELIYEDDDNDIAYYRVLDRDNLVSVGDTVYTINGDETTVTATDVYGFYVEYNEVFYPGMSGSVIINSTGNSVGYVSRLDNSEFVYCIWN
jgi:hypothetical protein